MHNPQTADLAPAQPPRPPAHDQPIHRRPATGQHGNDLHIAGPMHRRPRLIQPRCMARIRHANQASSPRRRANRSRSAAHSYPGLILRTSGPSAWFPCFLFPSFVVGDRQFVGTRVGRVGDRGEQDDQLTACRRRPGPARRCCRGDRPGPVHRLGRRPRSPPGGRRGPVSPSPR